jgi:hypothetical protein
VNGRDPAALDKAIRHMQGRMIARAEGNRSIRWSVEDNAAARVLIREVRRLRYLDDVIRELMAR